MANLPPFHELSKFDLPLSLETLPSPLKPADQTQEELAVSLLKKGEHYLLKGDSTGIHYFDHCLSLKDDNPEIFYAQGLALFEYGMSQSSAKSLRLAAKRFKAATKLQPNNPAAYHAWGNTLFNLALKLNNPTFFTTAKNKYKKAFQHIEELPSDLQAELHWDYAEVWSALANHSGEAIDLNVALQSYEEAVKCQDDLPPEFWQNFGQNAIRLGKQTNDLRFFVKGVDCFKNAISLNISCGASWQLLAEAVTDLYSYTQDEDHFMQANECFSTATKFQPNNANTLISWAKLLQHAGIELQDEKKLHACIEKCKRAALCDPQSITAIYIWTEALAHLGVITDNLKKIHEAQNKLHALQLKKTTPEYHYCEGSVLYALAEYFLDLDLYYQAIEQFQSGLSIDRSEHKLWFSLGHCYAKCAEIESDPKLYELAVKFYNKALNVIVSSNYHYHAARSLYKIAELTKEKTHLENALHHFEQSLALQKNAIYLHPHRLFSYACALDMYGDFFDSDAHYTQSLEILTHVLTVDPEFPQIHYQIALVYAHFADLTTDAELFQRSLHHFRIAQSREQENDTVTLDWALTLMNLAIIHPIPQEIQLLFQEAECKIIKAAKLGNLGAYYYLACLYALTSQNEKALYFLQKSHSMCALPPLQDILDEEWLDTLKDMQEFQAFIYSIEKSAHINENDA